MVRVMGRSGPQRNGILGVLQQFPRCTVDVRLEAEAPHTALNLPGVPVLAFVNDYGRLPVHTAQDSIDLMSPDELAFSAEVKGTRRASSKLFCSESPTERHRLNAIRQRCPLATG
jgi:hypothetical protein